MPLSSRRRAHCAQLLLLQQLLAEAATRGFEFSTKIGGGNVIKGKFGLWGPTSTMALKAQMGVYRRSRASLWALPRLLIALQIQREETKY